MRRLCGCSQVHITLREGLARGLLLLSSSAAPRRAADAQRDSPLRRRSRTRAAAATTPTARSAHACLHQGASAKEPVKIRQGRPENALRFRLGTRFARGQPLWQIVLRAYHGARAALYARFLDQPHPCGGCGCSQVHSSRQQALARGLHSLAPSAHRRPRHRPTLTARLSAVRRRSLASTRQLLPPPARRAHARLHHKGHRQKSPWRFANVGTARTAAALRFRLYTLHSGSAASTDRVESVARRTRAASRACLLVRPYP